MEAAEGGRGGRGLSTAENFSIHRYTSRSTEADEREAEQRLVSCYADALDIDAGTVASMQCTSLSLHASWCNGKKAVTTTPHRTNLSYAHSNC